MSRHRDGSRLIVPGNRWDLAEGMVPDPVPTLSVIVAYYDQAAQLRRTLLALDRQDYPADKIEIIVVDDGSPIPPQVPTHVRLIRQPDEGFRLSAARNRGAAAASNDVLVFLDADTSPEPGYLRAITRLPGLIRDAVTVGRRRHAALDKAFPEDPVETAGPAHELEEPEWLAQAYRQSRNLLDADYRSYRYLIGAVLACSRQFFAETGGFDESFTEYGGEDWEWAYRAWLCGGVLAHVPEAVAWHDGAAKTGRDPASLVQKNHEALRLANLIPVPGSRGHGTPTARADITVHGPGENASAGQVFVSQDSVLAAVPGSVIAPAASAFEQRFDRVRIEIHIENPLRVRVGGLGHALNAIESEKYAEVAVRSAAGIPLVTLRSRRAMARQRRWGGEPLLPTLELVDPKIDVVTEEVDVEAYVGGWA